jgi:hypothetical protein
MRQVPRSEFELVPMQSGGWLITALVRHPLPASPYSPKFLGEIPTARICRSEPSPQNLGACPEPDEGGVPPPKRRGGGGTIDLMRHYEHADTNETIQPICTKA